MFLWEDGAWCVCRPELGTGALQKALDYACGAGADCNPILQSGACYQPNTVAAHCSYAANSYYQRKGQAQGACDFAGTATLTNTDPSMSTEPFSDMFVPHLICLQKQQQPPLILSIISAGASGCTYPPTPRYTLISSMWFLLKKTVLLREAEMKLCFLLPPRPKRKRVIFFLNFPLFYFWRTNLNDSVDLGC